MEEEVESAARSEWLRIPGFYFMELSASDPHGTRIRHAGGPSDGQPSERRAAEAIPIFPQSRRRHSRPSDDIRPAKHNRDRVQRPEFRQSRREVQVAPLPLRRPHGKSAHSRKPNQVILYAT